MEELGAEVDGGGYGDGVAVVGEAVTEGEGGDSVDRSDLMRWFFDKFGCIVDG